MLTDDDLTFVQPVCTTREEAGVCGQSATLQLRYCSRKGVLETEE